MAELLQVEGDLRRVPHRHCTLITLMCFPIGAVVYLNALGQDMVILNTQKAAADLMDRRAAIYSDRPHNIVSAQIMCGGMAMVFQGYTPLYVLPPLIRDTAELCMAAGGVCAGPLMRA